MPEIELIVVPNTFSMPPVPGGFPRGFAVQTFLVRVPAFASPGCYWVRVRSTAQQQVPSNYFFLGGPLTYLDWYDPTDTSGLSYPYGVTSLSGLTYNLSNNRIATAIPPPVNPNDFFYLVNQDKMTARWLTLYFLYQGESPITISNLRIWLEYQSGCTPLPDNPDEEDDDDDDDDDDPNSGSGLYRAIKADSERAYLHIGNEAAIETLNIVDGSEAFASGSHAVKWWKQFDYDRRQGRLYGLGRDTEGDSSHVKYSEDGGMSMTEVYEVDCNSAVIQMDSEKKLLILLAEGTPPDPEDDESNGAVTLYVCEDGTTFENEGSPQYNSANLSARLLGMTYDPRSGGALFLLCSIGAETGQVLKSEDSGKSWSLFGGL